MVWGVKPRCRYCRQVWGEYASLITAELYIRCKRCKRYLAIDPHGMHEITKADLDAIIATRVGLHNDH